MDANRFKRIQEIFLAACDLSGDERARHLEQACGGDESLRQEVEALFAADSDTLHPVDSGNVHQAMRAMMDEMDSDESDPSASLRHVALPEQIGPYKVLGVLGEGGMGVVYHAQQREPIQREVALKLLRPGQDSKRVVARFEAERRTLALMDHTNIARVLDAGTDDTDHSFVVMELVRGERINDFCKHQNLTIEDRLRLFGGICRGVQHAHQKGIIHRDLKPSNILVTTEDGIATPKIIDFGIAKALGESIPGSTLTQEGQLVGTLEYMSPEQVRGETHAIDTRSDVYSLGIILYELIVGRLPYEVHGHNLAEFVQAITQQSPRPIRSTSTGEGRIDRDLETIVFKALEKSPDQRYDSVAALGDDIDRFLRSEPILARPPSATYQLRKLVARNKTPALLTAVLILLLAGSAITATLQAQAQRAQRQRAEAGERKARHVSQFLEQMLASADPARFGQDLSLGELLDVTARDLETGLTDQPELRAALHNTIGNAYRALGRFEDSKRHLETAISLGSRLMGEEHPDVTESKLGLATTYSTGDRDLADLAQAEDLAQQALDADRRNFGPEHTRVAAGLEQLGRVEAARANFARAESLLVDAVEMRRRVQGARHVDVAETLASLVHPVFAQGRSTEAEALGREAVDIRREQLGNDHALVAATLRGVGVVLHRRGDYEEAISIYSEAISIERRVRGDRHPGVAMYLNDLGTLYSEQGRLDEAEVILREALSIRTDAFGPDNYFVAEDYNNLAHCLEQKGKYTESEQLYRKALDVFLRKLGEEHPTVATSYGNVAVVAFRRGDPEEAERLNRKALDIRLKILGPDHVQTGIGHCIQSWILVGVGRFEEAIPDGLRAREIWTETLGPNHLFQGVALEALARAHHGAGRLDEAADLYGESIDVLRASVTRDNVYHVTSLTNLGRLMLDRGELDRARSLLEEALAILEGSFTGDLLETAEARLILADVALAEGKWREAHDLAREGLRILQLQYPAHHFRTAWAEVLLAAAVAESGDSQEAAALLKRGLGPALKHPGNLPMERARARSRALAFYEQRGSTQRAEQLRAGND